MVRRRVFVPPDLHRTGAAMLPPEEVHYVRHVLRLRNGDPVEVFDGEGRAWTGRLGRLDGVPAVVSLTPAAAGDPPGPGLCLAMAVVKAERFEWAVEKAAELGVHEIVPLQTRFSEVRLHADRLEGRLERWRRIAREASRQSGRTALPAVLPPEHLEVFLGLPERADSLKLCLHERGDDPWPEQPLDCRVVVIVGPEGGWHPDETELFARTGCRRLRLAGWTLRAETAALAALAIVRFERDRRLQSPRPPGRILE